MAHSGRLARRLAKARPIGWLSKALERFKPAPTPQKVSAARPRPPARATGPGVLWCHADGPSELSDLEDLIAQLAERDRPPSIVLTSRVLTADVAARDRFPDLVTLAQSPTEQPEAINRFLDHWRPQLCLWLGGSYAPHMISSAVDRGVRMINANAHLSTEGWQSNRSQRRTLRTLIDNFDRIFAIDKASEQAFLTLGVADEKLRSCGPLISGHQPPPFDETLHSQMVKALGSRPVWLACGVTRPELDAVLAAHRHAARLTHRLLLVLQPADPADATRFAAALHTADINFGRRSLGEEPSHGTQVILNDTADEMGLWLRIAPLTFLGRSLTDAGGTDPMDAAALGSAIVHGPSVRAFQDSYNLLSAAGATVCVQTEKSLAEAVCEISFPDVAARMAHAAWQVETRGADVVEAVEQEILTCLDTAQVAA